ncbi:hypothetical protein H8K38_08500 [Undibacterium sp. FT79W]|uniref:hypothetical protein n=1 Tax=Undibacterium sp. FT79W TaxID=2762296 RepID=UPI00164AE4AF|nr:hypothetical protein [Undibacterium sp. FT79W]MBC3877845.1 hypothetical protein [Undibacterium sp. FT79W]
MANKALATRQRMQFRVEPSQVGRHLAQHHATKLASGTKPKAHPAPATANAKAKAKPRLKAKAE